MKKKKKLLLHLLISLACVHESIVVFAIQGPVSSPIPSPISASMAAFSPEGNRFGSEEHTRMDLPKKMKASIKSSKNGGKSSDCEKGHGLAPFWVNSSPCGRFQNRVVLRLWITRCLKKLRISSIQVMFLVKVDLDVFTRLNSTMVFAAVKKLDCTSQDAEKEYENEVGFLCKFKHPNIISLLGFSSDNDTRTISLFVVNLASPDEDRFRYGTLSDFGLAVTDDAAQDKNNLKLSGKLTDKSDVYAFGVVLLELLLGRKPVEKLAPSQCRSIVTWAMPQLTDRSKLPNIVDPVIRDTMDLKHLYQVGNVLVTWTDIAYSVRQLDLAKWDCNMQVAAVAVLCVQSSVDNRCSALTHPSCSCGAWRDTKSYTTCSSLTRQTDSTCLENNTVFAVLQIA
ncbi:hypothetical protein F3Y22_tig00111014pilonHSYRG00018 [Hibiscus syriacus]|uniref:Tyrosine-protein kinase catalytic domain-containing protein n=1 Tax=Hibiscus syriacus TaxID=106335 RepID=A0A6A2Z636_HIBSY|nr:hypothetical protein F3Y22_tig00111014pilonHSYRG00018 [Hibiscus syriacus]